MLNFFAFPTINSWDEKVFQLTTVGICAVIVVILALVGIAVFRKTKNGSASKTTISTKQLVFSAIAMALAIVTSYMKLANLPFGGSVTFFSMFFIVLIGYWYGAKAGLMTAFAYGFLQFVLDPVFYSIPQMIIDYPLAFGALGLSGFFSNKNYGLWTGYIVAVFGRYVFAVLSGVIFFAHYAPEGMPVLLYSLGYNATYIVPEAIATLIVISLPPVTSALKHVKQMAIENLKTAHA